KQVMALESEECLSHFPVAIPCDLSDSDRGIAVADPERDPAEEGEGADVAYRERLGACTEKGLYEEGTGVRQSHHEEGDGGCLTEVDLRPTGTVSQGHEGLGRDKPSGYDRLRHGGQASGISMLVAEPLEDPERGVPLLLRGLLVLFKEVVA